MQLQGKQAAENGKNRYSKGEKLFQMQFETRQRVNNRQNKVVPGGGAAEDTYPARIAVRVEKRPG